MSTLAKHSTYAGPNSLYVLVGDLELWFSYDTVVAFRPALKSPIVSENDWGPTTGKHLNAIDGGTPEAKARRLPRPRFEQQFQDYLSARPASGTTS